MSKVPSVIIDQIRHMIGHRMNVFIIGDEDTDKTAVLREVIAVMPNVLKVTREMENLSVGEFIGAVTVSEDCSLIAVEDYEEAIGEVQSINEDTPIIATITVSSELDQQETLSYIQSLVGMEPLFNGSILNIEKKQMYRHNFHDDTDSCDCGHHEGHQCCQDHNGQEHHCKCGKH